MFADHLDDIESGSGAQSQVHHDHAEPPRRHRRHGFFDGLDADDLHPARLPDVRQHPQNKGVIVDYKNGVGCHIHEEEPDRREQPH